MWRSGELNKGQKTQVLMAYRGDWYGKDPNGSLDANWLGGGKLRITRLNKAKETGLYDYRGSKGNKIDWEMVPMGEYLVYTGQLPGDSPRTLCGLDAVVHHPGNRYSAMIIRMCSAAVILDRHTWEPVACLHNPEGSPGNLPVKKVSSNPDAWEMEFPDIKCVGHEAGFSPDGKNFTMMNNIRQNNMAVFDTADADPRNWKKITFVEGCRMGWRLSKSLPSVFLYGSFEDVCFCTVSKACKERHRSGGYSDVENHQEVRKHRTGLSNHGGHLRRKVCVANLQRIPTARKRYICLHAGHIGTGRLHAEFWRTSRLCDCADRSRAARE